MTGSSRKTTRSRIKSTNNNVDEDDHNNRKSIKKIRNGDPNSIKIMKINIKYLLGFGILASLVLILLIYHLIQPNEGEKQVEKLRVITPFPAPKIMDLIQFQGDHKESLYWGTYRPHVYLGIRSRTPHSLIAGLMWIGVKDGRYVMRHICEDSDELSTYGWTHHNGRDDGRQVMVDHGTTLTTDFLKVKGDGSGYGGDWAVRIDAQHDKSKLDQELWDTGHFFFYVADEEGNSLSLGKEKLDTHDSSLLAYGSRKYIGNWELHTDSTDNMEIHYSGFRTPHFHNLTELVLGTLGAHTRRVVLLQLPDSSDYLPSVLVFQISAKFPFRTDVAFVSGTGLKHSRAEQRLTSITGNLLSNKLIEKQRDFEDKYIAVFNLTDKVEPESATVGRAAVGNLLGGIGYFYGQSKIALTQDLSHPTNGNPPTLFLALHDLVRGTSSNNFSTTEINEVSPFLDRTSVRLEAWFQWFNNTQSGKVVGSYYWHGRDQATIRELNPKTLSSGLDDYPRASHPNEEERHLDLRCWMLRAADCMSSITLLLGKQNDLGKEYQSTANLLSNFELLNQVRLTWRQTETLSSNHASLELIRAVMERPQLRLVPHIGYVSLFPFIMGLVPSGSPILGKQLDHISNRSTLWTDYGLLSLARSSTLYMKRNTEHDPPYWRGPIWMNMNYMILSALHHYSLEDGPYKERARTIYGELRQNLIRNVVNYYIQTGYLWEQYDQ
ncbi:hypothetical protein MKX01_020654 [Papaver californicum]|nr:hypothetical protein MKX01_020654 [Papaver californicum]